MAKNIFFYLKSLLKKIGKKKPLKNIYLFFFANTIYQKNKFLTSLYLDFYIRKIVEKIVEDQKIVGKIIKIIVNFFRDMAVKRRGLTKRYKKTQQIRSLLPNLAIWEARNRDFLIGGIKIQGNRI